MFMVKLPLHAVEHSTREIEYSFNDFVLVSKQLTFRRFVFRGYYSLIPAISRSDN